MKWDKNIGDLHKSGNGCKNSFTPQSAPICLLGQHKVINKWSIDGQTRGNHYIHAHKLFQSFTRKINHRIITKTSLVLWLKLYSIVRLDNNSFFWDKYHRQVCHLKGHGHVQKNPIPIVEYGGGSMMLWGSFSSKACENLIRLQHDEGLPLRGD